MVVNFFQPKGGKNLDSALYTRGALKRPRKNIVMLAE